MHFLMCYSIRHVVTVRIMFEDFILSLICMLLLYTSQIRKRLLLFGKWMSPVLRGKWWRDMLSCVRKKELSVTEPVRAFSARSLVCVHLEFISLVNRLGKIPLSKMALRPPTSDLYPLGRKSHHITEFSTVCYMRAKCSCMNVTVQVAVYVTH
jgi:hypothetical protein